MNGIRLLVPCGLLILALGLNRGESMDVKAENEESSPSTPAETQIVLALSSTWENRR